MPNDNRHSFKTAFLGNYYPIIDLISIQTGFLYSTGTKCSRIILECLSDLVRAIFGSKFIEKKFTLDFFKASNVAKKRLFFLGVRKNGIIL